MPEVEPDIIQVETALKDAEAQYGPDHEEVADRLEDLARLLKAKKVRALDAANMLARAKVIRSKSGTTAHQEPAVYAKASAIQETPSAITAGDNEYMDCPRCAETIKAKAVVCRFCKTELAALAPSFPKAKMEQPRFIQNETPAQMRESKTNNKKLIVVLIVIALVGLAVKISSIMPSRSFDSPEETKTCSADIAPAIGASYKNMNLGISFAAFREQLARDGLLRFLYHAGKSTSTDAETTNYRLDKDAKLTIAGQSWQPQFRFINDDGVYRLYDISGIVKDYASVCAAFDEKYGSSPEEDKSHFWLFDEPVQIFASNSNEFDGPGSGFVSYRLNSHKTKQGMDLER